MKYIFGSLIVMSLTLVSCSHKTVKRTKPYPVALVSSGIVKNQIAPFPVYLTSTMESREEIEKKYSRGIFIVHTGHILNADLSKEENEKNLEKLSKLGINLVNLTLEDLAIAYTQGIKLESFNQKFLNSSVVDLTIDNLARGKNIQPFELKDGVAFIGLSDDKLDSKITNERFLLNDYVLSILKIKRRAQKDQSLGPIRSFVIIHNLAAADIGDVMSRLPPSFINSLAE